MRHAYQEVGFLALQEGADENQFCGFSLGFDFVAEHEFGARFIKEALGIPAKDIPIGVEDRTMTQVPTCLGFEEYVYRSADKGTKKTMPAALLYCTEELSHKESAADTVQAKVKALRLGFSVDVIRDMSWYEPERHDIVSAWSANRGFAVHVRGEANVLRLRRLHQALVDKDVSVADASIMGFKRKALSLVINSRLPQDVKDVVRSKDEAFIRLKDAAQATGIFDKLKTAGRRWISLTPRWEAQEGGELMFLLDPIEQQKYAHGWFSAAELEDWIDNKGPVVDHLEIEARLKADDPDWSAHLLRGLKACGMRQAFREKFVWLDKEGGRIGVRLRLLADNAGALKTGVYPLEQIQPYVEMGRVKETSALQPA